MILQNGVLTLYQFLRIKFEVFAVSNFIGFITCHKVFIIQKCEAIIVKLQRKAVEVLCKSYDQWVPVS